MVDVSRLLGAAPTATVASSSWAGGGTGDVKKGNKTMLGMTASNNDGMIIGTVVGVDTQSAALLVRDENAQHQWVHIAAVTLMEGDASSGKSKLNHKGSCPVPR